jgi:hypothetical protein
VKVCHISNFATGSARDRQHCLRSSVAAMSPDSQNSSARRPLRQRTTVEGSVPCTESLPQRKPGGRKEDRGSAVLKKAESRQPASCYAECSARCPACCSAVPKEERSTALFRAQFLPTASQLPATQNTPPGIQQAHPAQNSFHRPAIKSYVVVATNTDIPQTL